MERVRQGVLPGVVKAEQVRDYVHTQSEAGQPVCTPGPVCTQAVRPPEQEARPSSGGQLCLQAQSPQGKEETPTSLLGAAASGLHSTSGLLAASEIIGRRTPVLPWREKYHLRCVIITVLTCTEPPITKSP